MGLFDGFISSFSDSMVQGASMGMGEKKDKYSNLADYELERMLINDEPDKVAAYLLLMERHDEYYNEDLYWQVTGNHFVNDKYQELIEEKMSEIENELETIENDEEILRRCFNYIKDFQENRKCLLSAIAVTKLLFECEYSYTDLKEEGLIIQCELGYLKNLYREMRQAEKG